MKTKNIFWLFLFVMTLLRLRAASQLPMGVDEAHYVLYAKFWDWSYFDHPPLVGWVHALFQFLPLDHLIKARLPALVISLFTSQLIFNYFRDRNTSEWNSFLAVAVLNLTPMYNAMSLALLPDTLLMPLTFLIITSTEKIMAKPNLKNWVLLGLWLGLAGLSKYTAVLYIAALVILFIFYRQFRELLKINLWAGVSVALLLISPVLFWNFNNNFLSFQYQADHVLHADSNILKSFSSSFAMQLGSWGIGPFLLALFGFVKTFRQNKIQSVFLAVFLVFFIYVSASEVLLPHWMLIFFVVAIPAAYAHFLEHRHYPRTLVVSFLISAFLSLFLLFEIGFKVLPARWSTSVYEGLLGWEELMHDANQQLNKIQAPRKAIAVMNWTLGSRAMYYNLSPSEIFIIDSRHDQFDIWQPHSPVGYDLIVLVEAHKKQDQLPHLNCAELTSVGEKVFNHKNVPVSYFLYYHCANFLGYKD